MKLLLLLVGSVSSLVGCMLLFGVVPNCDHPTELHWWMFGPVFCRTGFDSGMPMEPSAIFAIPLLLILAVWLKRKFFREKDTS